MHKVLVFLVAMTVFMSAQADTYVNGYFRKNGTYVQPHYRTSPNGTTLDNYSTRGNVNPYTGKAGTIDPNGYTTNTASNSYPPITRAPLSTVAPLPSTPNRPRDYAVRVNPNRQTSSNSEWQVLEKYTDDIYYIDLNSIRTESRGYKGVWMKVSKNLPAHSPTSSNDSSLHKISVDCNGNRYAMTAKVVYAQDGSVNDSSEVDTWNLKWSSPVPDTIIGKIIGQYVCI